MNMKAVLREDEGDLHQEDGFIIKRGVQYDFWYDDQDVMYIINKSKTRLYEVASTAFDFTNS